MNQQGGKASAIIVTARRKRGRTVTTAPVSLTSCAVAPRATHHHDTALLESHVCTRPDGRGGEWTKEEHGACSLSRPDLSGPGLLYAPYQSPELRPLALGPQKAMQTNVFPTPCPTMQLVLNGAYRASTASTPRGPHHLYPPSLLCGGPINRRSWRSWPRIPGCCTLRSYPTARAARCSRP